MSGLRIERLEAINMGVDLGDLFEKKEIELIRA